MPLPKRSAEWRKPLEYIYIYIRRPLGVAKACEMSIVVPFDEIEVTLSNKF